MSQASRGEDKTLLASIQADGGCVGEQVQSEAVVRRRTRDTREEEDCSQ